MSLTNLYRCGCRHTRIYIHVYTARQRYRVAALSALGLQHCCSEGGGRQQQQGCSSSCGGGQPVATAGRWQPAATADGGQMAAGAGSLKAAAAVLGLLQQQQQGGCSTAVARLQGTHYKNEPEELNSLWPYWL